MYNNDAITTTFHSSQLIYTHTVYEGISSTFVHRTLATIEKWPHYQQLDRDTISWPFYCSWYEYYVSLQFNYYLNDVIANAWKTRVNEN